MPGITGRDARPLEGVEETELFRRAFPDDGEGMRLAARGSEPADAGGIEGGKRFSSLRAGRLRFRGDARSRSVPRRTCSSGTGSCSPIRPWRCSSWFSST